MLDNFYRYGFNSDGSKVVHDRLKVRDKQSYGKYGLICQSLLLNVVILVLTTIFITHLPHSAEKV